MQTGIHNKVALATASTQGIGFATAQLLAEEGATVWVHGRGGDNLQDALRRIRQAVPGARVNGVAADLAADDGVRHLLEQVPAADILVNGYARILARKCWPMCAPPNARAANARYAAPSFPSK